MVAAALSFTSDRPWIGVGFAAALVLYLLFVRKARCRVATNNGRPCPWSARGYLGSCRLHQGLKRGLPVVTASGAFGLPGLMWQKPDLPRAPRAVVRPAAAMHEEAVGDLPVRSTMEKTMLGLTVVGVVIALAAFIRDVVAG